jgi:hypothetical protein
VTNGSAHSKLGRDWGGKRDFNASKWKAHQKEQFAAVARATAKVMEEAKQQQLTIKASEALLSLTNGSDTTGGYQQGEPVPPTNAPHEAAMSLNVFAALMAELQYHTNQGDLLPEFQTLCNDFSELLDTWPLDLLQRLAHVIQKPRPYTLPLIGSPNPSATKSVLDDAVVVMRIFQSHTLVGDKLKKITGKPNGAEDKAQSECVTGELIEMDVLFQASKRDKLTQLGKHHNQQKDFDSVEKAVEIANIIIKRLLKTDKLNQWIASKLGKATSATSKIKTDLRETVHSAMQTYVNENEVQKPVLSVVRLLLHEVLNLMIKYMDRKIPVGNPKTNHLTHAAWEKFEACYTDQRGIVETSKMTTEGRVKTEGLKGPEAVHEVAPKRFFQHMPSQHSISEFIDLIGGSDPFQQNPPTEWYHEAVVVTLRVNHLKCIRLLRGYFECSNVQELSGPIFEALSGSSVPNEPTNEELKILEMAFQKLVCDKHIDELWETVLDAEKRLDVSELRDTQLKLQRQFITAHTLDQELLILLLIYKGQMQATACIDANGAFMPSCSTEPCPDFLLLIAMSMNEGRVASTDPQFLGIMNLIKEKVTTDAQKELVNSFTKECLMGTSLRLRVDADGKVQVCLLVVEDDYSPLRPVQSCTIGVMRTHIEGPLPSGIGCHPLGDVLEQLSQEAGELTPELTQYFETLTQECETLLKQLTSPMTTYVTHEQTSKNQNHDSTKRDRLIQDKRRAEKEEAKKAISDRNGGLKQGGDFHEVVTRNKRMIAGTLGPGDYKVPSNKKQQIHDQSQNSTLGSNAQGSPPSSPPSFHFDVLDAGFQGSPPEGPLECAFCGTKLILIENETKCPMTTCFSNKRW